MFEKKGAYSFSEIQQHLGNPAPSVVRYNLKKLMQKGMIDKIRNKFCRKNIQLEGYRFYTIGGYQFKIGYYYHQEYDFEKILEAAGCNIRRNNENKKDNVLEITGESNLYCLEICKIAYFYWWAKMLAIRIDGRFQMLAADNVLKAEEAISFFFNGINHVLPKFQYFRYGEFKYPSFSCFSYLLGREVIKDNIESKEDIRRLLGKLSDDIGMLMKKSENSKNYDFELAEELKNDLIRFSNDKLICKHIYQGIHETILLDGAPHLNFKKNQTRI